MRTELKLCTYIVRLFLYNYFCFYSNLKFDGKIVNLASIALITETSSYRFCNALRFLTAKYSYTCANSVDPDHTAPGEDIYLHIAIVCAYLSWIILW